MPILMLLLERSAGPVVEGMVERSLPFHASRVRQLHSADRSRDQQNVKVKVKVLLTVDPSHWLVAEVGVGDPEDGRASIAFWLQLR